MRRLWHLPRVHEDWRSAVLPTPTTPETTPPSIRPSPSPAPSPPTAPPSPADRASSSVNTPPDIWNDLGTATTLADGTNSPTSTSGAQPAPLDGD